MSLNIYGIHFSIQGDESYALDLLEKRFHFFVQKQGDAKTINISFKNEMVDLRSLPIISALGVSPRNFFYRKDNLLYADYFGKGLSVHDLKDHSLTVSSDSTVLIYEIIYLFILSQVSTLLEKDGMYRVHGIGFEKDGDGYLLLLPSGGGKSTLALRLLTQTDCKLISEDSPLLGRKNYLFPFPLGIGAKPETVGLSIPNEMVMTYERMEFPLKTVVLSRYYEDRIADPVPLRNIIIGKRSLGGEAKICKISIFVVFKVFLTKMVVGIGLFQGIEYLLHRRRLIKIGIFLLLWRRFFKMVRTIIGPSKYIFHMGHDYDKNFEVLMSFLNHKKK